MLSIVRHKRFVPPTPLAPSTSKQPLNKIKETKGRGYAGRMRERDLDTGGIAAPVFNHQGMIGSIAVIGPVDRMERNGIQRIGTQVLLIANEITRELTSANGVTASKPRRVAG